MSSSRIPGPLNPPDGLVRIPARTPGPLGFNDHGDPNVTTLLGDTPGPLGIKDHADPNLPTVRSMSGLHAGAHVRTADGTPLAGGSDSAEGKSVQPNINGVIVAGGPLSAATVLDVNAAAVKTPSQWRRYIAYESVVKVGGSLAWRANNPGNLRDAATKIGSVSGAVGHFAVFASLDDGRAAQRDLYESKYGAMKVRDAINKLTPPSENDTANYLSELQKAGKEHRTRSGSVAKCDDPREALGPNVLSESAALSQA